MVTERLYDRDAYIRSFTAAVLNCEKQGERYAVILDKTAFFPEGGGQPADVGTLDGAEVSDVREIDGDVVHFCVKPLEVGKTVEGVLDWDKRFSLMQQHSGEHLVSGIIHSRYGFDNIGFHMGSEIMSIDFNGHIPPEDLPDIELIANRAVWANIETEILYPNERELSKLDYRSKKKIDGQVRIVRFPEIDICACCGTHIRRTGEIGIIKLLGSSKAHGGTRIEMACGKNALHYVQAVGEQNTKISNLLSAKPLETADAVQKLLDDRNDTLAKMAQIEKNRFENIAKSMQGKKNCLIFENDLSSDGVRELAVAVMNCCEGICAAFSGNDTDGYKYAIGEQDGDLREFVKQMNTALSGRGGGKPFFVQGSVSAEKSKIEDYFATLGFLNT